MRAIGCGIKTAFLYIGAVVGAGFATGREVVLYFGGHGAGCAAAAGVTLGGLLLLFLLYGRALSALELRGGRIARLAKRFAELSIWIMRACALISFLCMCAAAETLAYQCLGLRGLGLIAGVGSAWLAFGGMDKVRGANLLLVPLIAIVIFALAFRADTPPSGKFSLSAVLGYGGMNVALGGCLTVEQGKSMRLRDAVVAAAISAAAFALLLVAVYRVASGTPDASMPVFEFARRHGAAFAAAIVILAAVFTTLTADAALIAQGLPKTLGCAVLCLTAAVGFGLDFARAVDLLYPIVGWVGVAYTASVLLWCVVCLFLRKRIKQSICISNKFQY